jgi:hypothetical protein
MISFILGLIPGLFTTLNGITNAIANERIAALNAKTDQERVAVQERIGMLQAQQAVLIADSQHSNIDIWVRFFLSIGPTIYLTKIFIYDKVLGWGSTDPLDPNLWNVVTAVLGFYFLYTGATTVARIIKS